MKRLTSFLVALFLATTALWAYDFKYGDLYYNILSENTVEVTYEVYGGDGTNYLNLTSVTIPATVINNGIAYDVTCIGHHAFNRCSTLKEIVFKEKVRSIGHDAFGYCDSLVSVVMGNKVRIIGNYAFIDCNKLSNVVLSNSIDTIGWDAFYRCSINKIILPDSLKYIGLGAFCCCYNLASLTISRNVNYIGTCAFLVCDNLTNLKAITVEAIIPPLLETSVFGNSDYPNAIDTIYIPCGTKEAYTSIHWGGFEDDKFVEMECSPFGQCGDNLYWSYGDDTLSITGTGDMYDYQADSANAAPWLLFRDSISEVVLPEGITYIGTHAFRQLPLLTEVTILNAVEEIGESAFAGCAGLGKVVIGSGNNSRLTTMGDSVFIHSRKLYEIHIAATEPPIADRTTFLNYNVHLYVPCESKDKYDLDMVFGDFKYIECLDTDTPVEDFAVTPAQTSAKFVWGAPSNAATYTLDLQQEDAPFFTLVFNATGQVQSISLAPIGSQVRLTAAEKAGNGFTFNATGLTPLTLYNYDLTIRDAAEVVLQNYSGYFYTTSDIPTGTEDVATDDTTPRKVFRDGQVYILRGGKVYTVMGQETSDLSDLSRGEAQ